MCSSHAEIAEAVGAFRAGLDRLCGLTFDVLTTPEVLPLLDELETAARQLPVPGHALINQLAAQATPEELGGSLSSALASRLRITRADAGRCIAEAEDLGARRSLTGEPLEPRLGATAAAQRDGRIGAAHITVIRGFFAQLPDWVDPGTRVAAEADLADKATGHRPDQLADFARLLMDYLHPDGNYTDEDRARRRGITLGNQEYDGMSRISGLVSPELHAAIEGLLAKLAAPGMCNPDDSTPCVDEDPTEEVARRDTRSQPQRNHDAMLAGIRALLASGTLGQHRGLPATIIVTTTLKELEAGAGRGLTAGGSLLPMSDVIGMARHAHHYLAIFDGGKSLGLYHTKRLASPAQRIMLLGKERGCSAPGCDKPGYWTEVHHVHGWAATHRTDIDDLTLACGPDNRLLEESGFTTRKNARGETEWIPPPHLDHGQPRVNTFHHPEKLFAPDDEDGDGGEDGDEP